MPINKNFPNYQKARVVSTPVRSFPAGDNRAARRRIVAVKRGLPHEQKLHESRVSLYDAKLARIEKIRDRVEAKRETRRLRAKAGARLK